MLLAAVGCCAFRNCSRACRPPPRPRLWGWRAAGGYRASTRGSLLLDSGGEHWRVLMLTSPVSTHVIARAAYLMRVLWEGRWSTNGGRTQAGNRKPRLRPAILFELPSGFHRAPSDRS